MDYNNLKFKGKTQYKHVSEYFDKRTRIIYYKATLRSPTQGYNMTKIFSDIREAALCVDKYLINKGKEPVNILKRK
jgi:hypothetical protein